MLTKLVDFKYYNETYGGSSIPEPSFDKSSIEASKYINFYTSNSITVSNDFIRNTACEVAELIYSQNILKDKVLSDETMKVSETVGPHSVSYVNNKNIQEKRILSSKELDGECYKICYKNLVHTGLMFRGIV